MGWEGKFRSATYCAGSGADADAAVLDWILAMERAELTRLPTTWSVGLEAVVAVYKIG